MKRVLLLCLLLGTIAPLFSQNATYIMNEGRVYEENEGYLSKEGRLYVSPKEGSIIAYNKQNSTGGYFLEDGNIVYIKGKTITIHDAKTLKTVKSIPIKNFPEDRKRVGCVRFKTEYIMFFSSILNKKAKVVQFYFQKLNIETGMLSDEIALMEVEKTRKNYRKNGFHHTSFLPLPEFELSKDGSKLMFSCHNKIRVYKEGMDLIWESNQIYGKYAPKRFYDLQDEMLDNDGTHYAILKVFRNDDNPKLEWHHWEAYCELVSKKDRTCNYDILVLKINESGVEKIEADGLKDILLHSLTLHKTVDDKLISAGLYFKDDGLYRSAGILSIDLTENSTPIYYPIPTENHDKPEGKGGQATGGIKNLHGLEIKNTEDGNLLLISEQVNGFFSYLREGSSGAIGNHGDVLVSKIDLEGNLTWMKRLEKSQIFNINPKSVDSYGCESYKYLYLNEKHYIVYLDNKKNKDTSFDKIETYCSSCKNGGVFAFVLSDNGEVKKELLFDIDKEGATSEYDFKEDMRTISETELIFPVLQKKKMEAIVKITVK